MGQKEKKYLDNDRSSKPKSVGPETKPNPPEAKAAPDQTGLSSWQDRLGNQAVQRMLDEQTSGRIEEARGQGRPLDPKVQAKMQAGTGQNLSDVQIHTDREADALSRKLGANAFTVGQDIFFREGAYDPDSQAGRSLLGHEVAHTIQQQGDEPAGGAALSVNTPGDLHEREADAVAGTVLEPGGQVQIQGQALAGIQRQEELEEEMPVAEEIEMPAEDVEIVEEEEEVVE